MSIGNTKADLIDGAYSKMRLSGLTVIPSGADNLLAIETLEDMASQFYEKGICTGYNFEDAPDSGSLHNMERKFQGAFKSNLALWLCTPFGKTPPPTLIAEAGKDSSYLFSITSTVKMTEYPSRQPIGSGNRRCSFSSNFYQPTQQAPSDCATKTMYVDGVKDFTESFNSMLNDGETIASFTINADTGLTITSSSLATSIVSYRITATGPYSELLKLVIVATTSAGRIEPRFINFKLLDSEL